MRLPGEWHYVELKGKLTPNERRRLEAFYVQYVFPHGKKRKFRILFMRDNWLTKKKLDRYTDWASDLGIECAVGNKIPEEWVTWKPL